MNSNDYAEKKKNLILFMSLYPKGLTSAEIHLLCRRFSKWFGGDLYRDESMFHDNKTAPAFSQIRTVIDFVDS